MNRSDIEKIEQVERLVAGARCPEDVFGPLAGRAPVERLAALRRTYAALCRTCHPDLVAEIDRPVAERTFARLATWKRIAEEKIRGGAYGNRTETATDPDGLRLTIRGRSLTLGGILGEGSFASVRAAEAADFANGAAFVKIARDPADNDLIEREYRVLRRLYERNPVPEIEQFLRTQRAYAPCPVTAFTISGQDGSRRRASLFSAPAGRCFTAAALRRDRFPTGMEPRHVYWIFRRLLLTLWMAHLHGLVHGAVTPDHVLIYPEAHGLVLLGWTCAAGIDAEHIPAFDPAWQGFFPPELLGRAPAAPAMDLYMAAATAVHLLGGAPEAAAALPDLVPGPVAAELQRCLRTDPRRRPQDAERLHETFGDVIESVHGRRTYAELVV